VYVEGMRKEVYARVKSQHPYSEGARGATVCLWGGRHVWDRGYYQLELGGGVRAGLRKQVGTRGARTLYKLHVGRKRLPKLYTVKSALPGEADEMSAAIPTRTIACSVEGCSAKFIRHHDLEKHLKEGHRKLQEDAIDPRLQREAGNDEQFWVRGVHEWEREGG
jgi:hypothetical protein